MNVDADTRWRSFSSIARAPARARIHYIRHSSFIHLIHQFNHHHSASSSPPKNAHTQAGRLSENFTSFHSVSLGHVPHPATIEATHSNARRVLFSTCLQDSNNRMMAGSNGICLGAYAILVSPSHLPPFVRQGHKLYCRVCITLVQGVLTIYPLLPTCTVYPLIHYTSKG